MFLYFCFPHLCELKDSVQAMCSPEGGLLQTDRRTDRLVSQVRGSSFYQDGFVNTVWVGQAQAEVT